LSLTCLVFVIRNPEPGIGLIEAKPNARENVFSGNTLYLT